MLCWLLSVSRCVLQDLSYKELHWHEKCFQCSDCQASLVDRPFATQNNRLYCADCHDNNFAPRCDQCGHIFRAGICHYQSPACQPCSCFMIWFICLSCSGSTKQVSIDPRPLDHSTDAGHSPGMSSSYQSVSAAHTWAVADRLHVAAAYCLSIDGTYRWIDQQTDTRSLHRYLPWPALKIMFSVVQWWVKKRWGHWLWLVLLCLVGKKKEHLTC